jgi:hypothetical protein
LRRTTGEKPASPGDCQTFDDGAGKYAGKPAEAFMTYDCMNSSNIVESYSLLEPDICIVNDGNGKIKIMV